MINMSTVKAALFVAIGMLAYSIVVKPMVDKVI